MTSQDQLKGNFGVKLRVLVIFGQDIRTVPNFIDFCSQVNKIWPY